MEHMTKIYHGSVNTEATLLKKIEDVEESVKNLNENFEAMTVQLEDVQEKMYDFEQNKKNNLIFYGVPGDNRESKDDLKHKISNLLKLRLNIRRDIPLVRASRMLTGTYIIVQKNFYTIRKYLARSPSARVPALAGDVRDVQGPRGRAEEREGADEEQRDGDRGPEQADTGEQAGAQEVHEGDQEEEPGEVTFED